MSERGSAQGLPAAELCGRWWQQGQWGGPAGTAVRPVGGIGAREPRSHTRPRALAEPAEGEVFVLRGFLSHYNSPLFRLQAVFVFKRSLKTSGSHFRFLGLLQVAKGGGGGGGECGSRQCLNDSSHSGKRALLCPSVAQDCGGPFAPTSALAPLAPGPTGRGQHPPGSGLSPA